MERNSTSKSTRFTMIKRVKNERFRGLYLSEGSCIIT